MPPTTEVSANQKSAYQRPYKTRSQRREIARRKYEENHDHKFLTRVALVVGMLVLVAVGIALKGLMEPDATPPPTTQAPR